MARLDPFLDVMLREGAEQLYLLPNEPVSIVKGGTPRKVSKQPLTEQHIYAMLAEIAPSDVGDRIDQRLDTEFDYAADKGLVRIRIVPEKGQLTAIVTAGPTRRSQTAMPAMDDTRAAPGAPAAPAPKAAPRPPRPSVTAAAPMVGEAPVAAAGKA